MSDKYIIPKSVLIDIMEMFYRTGKVDQMKGIADDYKMNLHIERQIEVIKSMKQNKFK